MRDGDRERRARPGRAGASLITRCLAAGFFVALLAGCAEPIDPSRMDYVGEWRAPGMMVLILADGSFSYERLEGGVTTTMEAPLKAFVGDDFVVGLGFIETTFVVTEPPHQVDGEWQMVVDGVRLTRVAY